MIQNFRRVVFGLLASTASLTTQVCPAQVPTMVIPQRRAPQAFLVQDVPPAPIVPVQFIAPTVTGTQIPVSDENLQASLRGVVLQSLQLTKEGVKLATKGATYSARGKFLTALQLIADALDARHNTQFHSRALSAGATALREADDFGHADSSPSGDSDPASLAVSHVTPILRQSRPLTITRLQALQLYYSYATTQFAAAVGGIPEA
jgi:hypothetical protein